MIRDKIREIGENIDKFKIEKDYRKAYTAIFSKGFFRKLNIKIEFHFYYRDKDSMKLSINNKLIDLNSEENDFLFKKIKENTEIKTKKLLNVVKF